MILAREVTTIAPGSDDPIFASLCSRVRVSNMASKVTIDDLEIIARIAVFRGLKPESLSRTFAKLRSIGVIVHATHVAVSDVAKLRELAADQRAAIHNTLRRP